MALLGQKVLEVAAEKAAGQTLISELKQMISGLEDQISSLNHLIQQEKLLTELVEQLTVRLSTILCYSCSVNSASFSTWFCLVDQMEKQNLQEELQEVRQQEEDMCGANRALMRHLEDTQVT